MRQRRTWRTRALTGSLAVLAACGGERNAGGEAAMADSAAADSAPMTAAIALTVSELENPEAARFDPELEVYFVSNVNGSPMAKDGNGYISRLTRDGKVDSLKFIAGGRGGVTLNAPKGLAIVGDTLWVADIDAARAFHRRTGKPLATVNLRGQAKFLNDAAVGPDGVYFTDTGVAADAKGEMAHPGPDRIFRVSGGKGTVALEFKDMPGPNGLTWDSAGAKFVIVPFQAKSIFLWAPGDSAPTSAVEGPGMMDGIEALGDGRFVVSSWVDSSLFILADDRITQLIGGLPSPADIAIDRERGRIAVPLLMENRLEFVDLER